MSQENPSPEFATDYLSPDRFDEAIKKSITDNPEMTFDFHEKLLTCWGANIIRKLRGEQELTQKEIAEKVGISQSFIARLENPNSNKEMSINTLVKVLNVLGYKAVINLIKVK